jgi:hypothetical protein
LSSSSVVWSAELRAKSEVPYGFRVRPKCE